MQGCAKKFTRIPSTSGLTYYSVFKIFKFLEFTTVKDPCWPDFDVKFFGLLRMKSDTILPRDALHKNGTSGCPVSVCHVFLSVILVYCIETPRAGSGVVRMDPLCFLAGCRKRQLNQALSVLSLSLGFF